MTVTDIALIIFILALLAYAVYDEFIMGKKSGTTLLKVLLQRRNKLDAVITTYLLISLALIAFYISFIRWPKMLFKATGFYYANIFITYDRIKAMNLSEDGILVIQLEQKRLLVRVKQMDDLEHIYKFMVNYQ
jgi:uncharacterized membrane protein YobD (UPF0266 family)